MRRPRLRRPRLRGILSFLVSFVIALVGAVGVILFFESRDESQLEGEPFERHDRGVVEDA